jgi:hypothetical protein
LHKEKERKGQKKGKREGGRKRYERTRSFPPSSSFGYSTTYTEVGRRTREREREREA